MRLPKRFLTQVKFCKPQHFVARQFKVTNMLYEEILLVYLFWFNSSLFTAFHFLLAPAKSLTGVLLIQKRLNYKLLMAINVSLGIWCVYVSCPIFTFSFLRDVIFLNTLPLFNHGSIFWTIYTETLVFWEVSSSWCCHFWYFFYRLPLSFS